MPSAPTDPRDSEFKPRVGCRAFSLANWSGAEKGAACQGENPEAHLSHKFSPPPPPALSSPPSATQWQNQIPWRQGAGRRAVRVEGSGGKVTLWTSFHQLVALAHPLGLRDRASEAAGGQAEVGGEKRVAGTPVPFRVLCPPGFYPRTASGGPGLRAPGGDLRHLEATAVSPAWC